MLSLRQFANHHLIRIWIVGILLAVAAIALFCRLIFLTIIHQHFLQTQYTERTFREITLPSYRGIIADRNNIPLAVSTPVYALWIDPKKNEFSPTNEQLMQISRWIELPVKKIMALMKKSKNRHFLYLARDLSPQIANEIKNLNIKGLFLEKQYRRFYPDGESCAPLIGMTNIDDEGQEGLELSYNQWLKGEPGLKDVIKDRYGEIVDDVGIKRQPVPGHNLILSIDSRLQYIAYHELLQGVQQFAADSGSIVIIDVHTGEILAMASVPSFNPNLRLPEKQGNYRNRVITDLFEPGSSIKPFAMTTALASGKYHVHSMVDTHPGYWYVNGKKIDDDGHDEGVIDLTRILQVSSNVGVSKIILSLPHRSFLSLLDNLGFAQPTGINFPGESKGKINSDVLHSDFAFATLSFGYGISVNLLQLAHAYATLANDGVEIPLSLLKLSDDEIKNIPHVSKPVIMPKIAGEIRMMLEFVLKQGGTAKAARVYDYRVTGKTGTTRILGPHGYEKNLHNGDFIGIAPATNPKLVVAVMIHAPSKKAYFAGDVAGPIFSKVMGDSLRLLNVAPDNIDS